SVVDLIKSKAEGDRYCDSCNLVVVQLSELNSFAITTRDDLKSEAYKEKQSYVDENTPDISFEQILEVAENGVVSLCDNDSNDRDVSNELMTNTKTKSTSKTVTSKESAQNGE